MSLLKRIRPDLTALRRSRDYRLLVLGGLLSSLGTQAALVAVPFQVYERTRSPAMVGLVGAAELGPTIIVALLGGAVADRIDRRLLVLIAQAGVITTAAALALLALVGHPPVWLIFALAAALAGAGALDQLSRSSMLPALAGEWLRSAIAFNFGMTQLTAVVGPSLGGVVIATAGVGWAYAIDALGAITTVGTALMIAPQRPALGIQHAPILTAIGEGLRFVRADRALLGSFVIDIFAMTFGMPRALFVVLSLRVFHAGAAGAGLLYAAVAAGAAVGALANGWLANARWIGRITIAMVLLWGAAIAGAGAVSTLGVAAVLLALAGAADSVSAVCRSTIAQMITPDELRGRVSAVFGLVVTGGVRLGDIESGSVASLVTPRFAVVSGGLACLASVGAVVLAFPALARFDALASAKPAPSAA